MTSAKKTAAMALGAASVLALAAGCTTTNSSRVAYGSSDYARAPRDTGPDRLYRNDFVRNTRPETRQVELALAPAPSPAYAQYSPPAYGPSPLTLASFDGIEGARRAHQMFPSAQAEQLDGACERNVKIARYENLYDVEQLCDVKVSVLLAYNPNIRDARHIGEGVLIEVPETYNPERIAYVRSVLAAQPGQASHIATVAYVVQPGDTLNDIAARHLVSAAAVANVNPQTDWRYLQVGATVWIPSSSSVAPGQPLGASTPAHSSGGPVTGGMPYNFNGAGSGAGGVAYDVSTVMPYHMTPAQQASEKEGARKLLMINKRVVAPGEEVTITGENLPANRNQMEFVGTVQTDSNGAFSQSFPVTGDTGGGVIFQAAVDGEKRLQSPRVVAK
jgi:LysM repeat protein